jgi:hypothetical protein
MQLTSHARIRDGEPAHAAIKVKLDTALLPALLWTVWNRPVPQCTCWQRAGASHWIVHGVGVLRRRK